MPPDEIYRRDPASLKRGHRDIHAGLGRILAENDYAAPVRALTVNLAVVSACDRSAVCDDPAALSILDDLYDDWRLGSVFHTGRLSRQRHYERDFD